jgi:hypothetical protein
MSCGIKDEQGRDICLKTERKHRHGRGGLKINKDKDKGKEPMILAGGETE